MTENVAIQLAGLRHDAIIELFVLDATSVGGGVNRFHAGTNGLRQPVWWQGHEYQPFPIQAEGFSRNSQDSSPRPTLTVSNVLGLIGVLAIENKGLRGAKVTRKRTLRKYLDAANFAGGNAVADPDAGFVDEVWLVDRISRRDKYVVQFELASPMDVAGLKLPRRQVLADTCTLEYRGPDCGYTGGPVAKADDTPTSDPALDDCSHCLRGCRLRTWPNGELPISAFPGAGSVRRA